MSLTAEQRAKAEEIGRAWAEVLAARCAPYLGYPVGPWPRTVLDARTMTPVPPGPGHEEPWTRDRAEVIHVAAWARWAELCAEVPAKCIGDIEKAVERLTANPPRTEEDRFRLARALLRLETTVRAEIDSLNAYGGSL